MQLYEPVRKAMMYAITLKNEIYQRTQRLTEQAREKARFVKEDIAPVGLEFAVVSSSYIPVRSRETDSLLMFTPCGNND